MATIKGGKKRADKKPGRQMSYTKGAFKGSQLKAGLVNVADGRWVQISQAKLPNKMTDAAEKIHARYR